MLGYLLKYERRGRMNIKEKSNLEFKEKINKKFLKTVSAYANYNDGEIIFGIDDAGNVVGLDNIDNECIKIENMINDYCSV